MIPHLEMSGERKTAKLINIHSFQSKNLCYNTTITIWRLSMEVRTRFAPSPTGYMHIGNLRTALYTYLIAKSQGGKFILRIEDTDQERFVEGAIDVIYKTLDLVGLKHDEGPDVGGDYGPYIQSERQASYKEYAEELVEKGGAYYCFCTKERLDAKKEEAAQAGKTYSYDRHCRNLTKEEVQAKIEAGEPYVIRQKMPLEGTTTFVDEVYGTITVDNTELTDGILLKTDGMPTYNFANVIDDNAMAITHVIRGSEYLSSTPRYNLLYKAFGWNIPKYVHLPLIMKEGGKKLSKRHGDASFEDFYNKGYLKEAITNYVALLGWSSGTEQEFYTLEELVQAFDIKGISKSESVFDVNKLTWMNAEYIRRLPLEKFHELALPYYRQVIECDTIDLMKVSELMQKRTEVLSEIPEKVDFLQAVPEYDVEMYRHKRMKTTPENAGGFLEEILPVIESVETWENDILYENIMEKVKERSVKNGQYLWPLRTALSGKQSTPGGATEIMELIGKEESVKRIKDGIKKLKSMV